MVSLLINCTLQQHNQMIVNIKQICTFLTNKLCTIQYVQRKKSFANAQTIILSQNLYCVNQTWDNLPNLRSNYRGVPSQQVEKMNNNRSRFLMPYGTCLCLWISVYVWEWCVCVCVYMSSCDCIFYEQEWFLSGKASIFLCRTGLPQYEMAMLLSYKRGCSVKGGKNLRVGLPP